MSRFYLTTAIDYANGDPHLWHAFEKIGADAIARYRRLKGDDVHFLMGMDEHGQKVKQAADECRVSPQTFVDRVAATFEDITGLDARMRVPRIVRPGSISASACRGIGSPSSQLDPPSVLSA